MTSPCNTDPIRFLVWSDRRAARKAIKKELDKVANNDNQRRKLEFVQGALKLKGKLIRFCNENSKKGCATNVCGRVTRCSKSLPKRKTLAEHRCAI